MPPSGTKRPAAIFTIAALHIVNIAIPVKSIAQTLRANRVLVKGSLFNNLNVTKLKQSSLRIIQTPAVLPARNVIERQYRLKLYLL